MMDTSTNKMKEEREKERKRKREKERERERERGERGEREGEERERRERERKIPISLLSAIPLIFLILAISSSSFFITLSLVSPLMITKSMLASTRLQENPMLIAVSCLSPVNTFLEGDDDGVGDDVFHANLYDQFG